ncbi:DEAD/DEAH box helicase family protein [Sorangium sp. So ce726]
MNKKDLTERDICTKYITPAIVKAGWDLHTQLREEYQVKPGPMLVHGNAASRGKFQRADYVLLYKPNVPLAVVEAKDNNVPISEGMQQALRYAEALDVPFAYASNGDGFVEHDRTGNAKKPERHLSNDEFPSPDELWERYAKYKGLTTEAQRIVTLDYFPDAPGKAPRYYQINAINRVLEAVALKQRRILLVMATGTGKTYTAFQIIWRLWKAGVKKRILFLADRNILVDQTKTNDFKPFGGAMTKITDRKVDKSFEIYLALYQAISGADESKDIFKQFSRDFFDLIVVDECHRGSADQNSAWREILEYFTSATQLGLTATPKETADVSTTDYFGPAVYTYSLKQGIEDGFLAPYKVVRFDLDKDLEGWRPPKGKKDKLGREIELRTYRQRDFDRNLVLEQRTELVARKISEFLKATDRFAKTIVFCEDIEHAERMREALVNQNGDLCAKNRRYVMRITGDSPEGKAELDNFIHPEERYPVLVTTSKLLSTGVDTQTCKVIVLDQNIESMSEFKQIIGRGTRIHEEAGKQYFTILDFRRATAYFADPAFDGEPVQVYEPRRGDPAAPPDDLPETAGPAGEGAVQKPVAPAPGGEGDDEGTGAGARPMKYVVADVPVLVVMQRVEYYGKDGKPINESVREFSKKAVLGAYGTLDAFVQRWIHTERKRAVVDELIERGLLLDHLAEEIGREYAAFDLVCHVAFGQPPISRKQRASNLRQRKVLAAHGEPARAVLEALLAKYAEEGVEDIADLAILKVAPLTKLGTPMEIVRSFGGREAYLKAVRALENELYRAS